MRRRCTLRCTALTIRTGIGSRWRRLRAILNGPLFAIGWREQRRSASLRLVHKQAEGLPHLSSQCAFILDIMRRLRVLIAHPRLVHVGGGNAVSAWAIQALSQEHDVTLATLDPPDCAALNVTFGTHLSPEDFEVRVAPRGYQFLR